MNLNQVKLFVLLNLISLNNFILAEEITKIDSLEWYNSKYFVNKQAENSNLIENVIIDSEQDKVFADGISDFLGKYIYGILTDSLSQNTTNKCLKDFKYIFESLKFGGWPINMIDSYGKPESGILKGNIRWVGEFDECLKVYAPPRENEGVGGFHGQYCTLQVTVELGGANRTLSIGVCLPDTCESSEFISDFAGYLKLTGKIPDIGDKISSVLNTTKLSCYQPPKRLSAGPIVIIVLLSIFILLALIGSSITVYEYVATSIKNISTGTKSVENLSNTTDEEQISIQSNDPIAANTENPNLSPSWLEKYKSFFNCFCLITNGERILNTDSAEGQLPCLHGIRFLSMSWVILCHAYAICFRALRNLAEVGDLLDHWTFQIILNGFYSVDSFFLLGSFLVAHLFFKQCEKTNGKIPWSYFYIHRFIRLTPVYMIVVGFYTTLNKYLGSGPIWPDAALDTEPNCNVDWWMNLLYINNFNPDIQKCMAWTWYLAIDMQFYIISPLFLVTLWRWPKIGYSVLGAFLGITYITSFVISYHYNLITGLQDVISKFYIIDEFFLQWAEYFSKFYIKPYTRFDPYLIGIALAYLLYIRKKNNADKLNLVSLSAGWTVACVVTLTCLFGLYHQTPSRVASSFYSTFNRTGYACGLAWVIFVCINGQGGVVNRILSWKFWIPLSRLTFCAYLLHPIIEIVYFASVRRLIEFSHTIMIIHYLGFLIFSYAAAFVTSLLFESPVIRLERLIRNKFSS